MSTSYPPYVTIVRRESDIPHSKTRWRRHSMRLPGDGGPPRWEWSEPTQAMLNKRTPYSVSFVGQCKTCGKLHQAGCPSCQTNGIISEIIVVDSKSKPTNVRPVRTLEEYRKTAHVHYVVKSQQKSRRQGFKRLERPRAKRPEGLDMDKLNHVLGRVQGRANSYGMILRRG